MFHTSLNSAWTTQRPTSLILQRCTITVPYTDFHVLPPLPPLALIPPLGAQSLSFAPVDSGVLEARLKRMPADTAGRAQELKKLFTEAGCKQVAELAVKGADTPNIVCTLPGTEKTTVVDRGAL